MRNLSFKITYTFVLLGATSVQFQRGCCSLSRNLPGVSFSPCSMSVNLAKSLSSGSPVSFKNTWDKVTLFLSSLSLVIVPVWLCNGDCLIPSREGGYLFFPLY